MKVFRNFAGALFVLCVFTGSSVLGQKTESTNKLTTEIATLYARDPLAQSLCLRDGGYGSVFRRMRCVTGAAT